MLKKSLLLGSTLVLSAAIATPSLAQVDDEIIVTATKREQTLQEVPIAVTVTDAVTIERAQILDLKDLQSVVPTLRIPQFQNSNQANFIIRGFGNGANNPGIEPSVGVFIDGVYRSRAAAQIGDLPKLDRVEVISGPQSTLFGKNASVGVISIVTAKPSFDSTGYAEVGYGNFNQILAKGYVSGALSENVAGAISGGLNMRDGYFENLNGDQDINERQRFNIRGDLLFQPTDNVEFRLLGDYSNIDESCCASVLTDILDAAPAVGTAQNGTALFGAATAFFGLQANDPNEPFQYEASVNDAPVNEIDDYGLSFHADVSLYNGIDVTSISAYRVNDSFTDLDADFTNVDFLPVASQDVNIGTFTQELRFNGTAFDERVNWTLGGFYFNEDITFNSQLRFGTQTRPLFSALVGGAGGPAAGEATFAGVEQAGGIPVGSAFSADVVIDESFQLDNESYSIFGNVDFDVTDRFVLTLGAAYIEDEKSFTGSSVNGDLFSNVDLFGQQGVNAVLPGAFPQFAASCIDPTTGGLFGALPFSPANLGTILGTSPGCFISPTQPPIPANLAFGGFQQTIAALVASPANPLAGLTGLQFQPNFFAIPNSIESNRTNDDEITFAVRGAYDVNDNINVYASYSTGFKASSINLSRDSRPNLNDFIDANGRPIAANFAQLPNNFSVRTTDGQLISNTITDGAIPANAVVDPLTARNFGTRAADPEETENFEIGLKSKFDKGLFNLTLFQTTVDGFQSNVFNGAGFVLANAGEQRSRGAEWDIQYRPVEPLLLTFAGAYIDAEYIDFQQSTDILNIPQNRSGDTVAGISPWNFVVSATYDHTFANGYEGYIRGDFNFESNTFITDAGADFDRAAGVINSAIGPVPFTNVSGAANSEREVKTFNFAAGLDFQNGLALQGYVRNAFNDEYLQTTFNTPGLFGLLRGYPNQPRTYGINARYSF